MTPIPCSLWLCWYQNGAHLAVDDKQWFVKHRDYCFSLMKKDFNLDRSTPDYVLKDILLDNGFTDFCNLIFPESQNEQHST